jgi:SAM-dependent methyltransferase
MAKTIQRRHLSKRYPGLSFVGVPHRPDCGEALRMTTVDCHVCGSDKVELLAVGEDFEYRTSPDSFLTVRCRDCGLVYMKHRPDMCELDRIYPIDYHAFNFSSKQFGLIYKVRRSLEAKRLLRACKGLGDHAKILDVGCGDGFHLNLLRDFGNKSWQVEGIDMSDHAVRAGREQGLTIHHGIVQTCELEQGTYDLALMIATIEHLDDPLTVLKAVKKLLKPGGRVVIVTDNTDTLDFKIFHQRHWGGYHFPRHWSLFSPATMRQLATNIEMEVDQLSTIVSPVNWVYSIRNFLDDWGAPNWLVNRFSLNSPVSLAIFTLFDNLHQWLGHGALLRVVLQNPELSRSQL